MKIIQTTLTRTLSGNVLVNGTAEEKDMDCIVAHTIAPTYMKVRAITEAGDALADPGKALAAIQEAFQNPTLYKSECQEPGIHVEVAVQEGVPGSGSSLAAPSRPKPRITNPVMPEGFGRVLSHQECADGHFPEYRALLERACAALEENGRIRGESSLLDDLYSVLGK